MTMQALMSGYIRSTVSLVLAGAIALPLAACSANSYGGGKQNTGTVLGALGGAAAGAALGAITGALVGGVGAGEAAAFGAATGGAVGLGGGAVTGVQNQRDVYRRCMAGRGYNVLN